jgi:hypothetical protein
MLGAALKLIFTFLLNSRVSKAKSELISFKENVADYTESRAGIIKDNIESDLRRIVKSFIGILFIFACFILVGILGLAWLFAIFWNSESREIILGVIMSIPLIIGLITLSSIRSSWQMNPLLEETTILISEDWKSFRYGLDGTADISDEANL